VVYEVVLLFVLTVKNQLCSPVLNLYFSFIIRERERRKVLDR
jgi:hypothetical protein